MSYDAIIDRIIGFGRTFSGEVELRVRDELSGRIYRIRVKKTAVKELYRMVEASRRANYTEAVAIVRSAKERFSRFLEELDREYQRQYKLGEIVTHYYLPPSRMSPGLAAFFIPRLVLEEEAKRRREIANSPTFNPEGTILAIISAAATHEALEATEDFFQIYDVSAKKKGKGYDSPILLRFFEVVYSIVFRRVFR